ncbi:Protein MIZU-KUSSEI 1-like, plant [Sesbania bispinosa]|nr:Protein MIZU-KUSSEI 1-like, plant [Sesbania bispinosa]
MPSVHSSPCYPMENPAIASLLPIHQEEEEQILHWWTPEDVQALSYVNLWLQNGCTIGKTKEAYAQRQCHHRTIFGYRKGREMASDIVRIALERVLPSVSEKEYSDGEMTYMRARFERVVGSKDSEALYMINPDGAQGPEFSIFFFRAH